MPAQHREELPAPGVPLPPGRDRCGVAERIDHRHEAAAGSPPPRALGGVGHDGGGAAEAGEVPGLRRGHERDRPAGCRMVESRKGHVGDHVVQHQAGPDLVAHHRDRMPLAKIGQPQEIAVGEDRASRVVGLTQPEELRPRRDRGGNGIPVDAPCGGIRHQWQADTPPAGQAGQREKRWVDRREREDLIVGLGQEPGRDRQPRHDAGRGDDRGRIDRPGMQRPQMVGERRGEVGGFVRVAKHPVVDAGSNGIEYHFRGLEIHVGHPHRHHVAARPAIPLLRSRTPAIGAIVKLERAGGVYGHR